MILVATTSGFRLAFNVLQNVPTGMKDAIIFSILRFKADIFSLFSGSAVTAAAAQVKMMANVHLAPADEDDLYGGFGKEDVAPALDTQVGLAPHGFRKD